MDEEHEIKTISASAEKYRTAKPHAPRTEWEAKIEPFYVRINTPASLKKYGEHTRSRIGKALTGKSDLEIARLFAQCAKARSFGGLFRSLTEPKKEHEAA